jgi:3-isopropylmalate/(R)-2-methylmalate dehydratase small subunit
MQPFLALHGIAAPLFEPNIDTDQIIPGQFLKTISRTGLAKGLFYDRRHDAAGQPQAGFVLDTAPFDHAAVLVAGTNFGCGSSREHAPWALLDFGIRCVIAPSFGDIFYNNSLNNGLLPIVIAPEAVEELAAFAARQIPFAVDLETQTITAGRYQIAFDIDPKVRADLMSGRDSIERSTQHLTAIETVEAGVKRLMPWLARTADLSQKDNQ